MPSEKVLSGKHPEALSLNLSPWSQPKRLQQLERGLKEWSPNPLHPAQTFQLSPQQQGFITVQPGPLAGPRGSTLSSLTTKAICSAGTNCHPLNVGDTSQLQSAVPGLVQTSSSLRPWGPDHDFTSPLLPSAIPQPYLLVS